MINTKLLKQRTGRVFLGGVSALFIGGLPGAAAADDAELRAAVIDQYADIAHAAYEDSLKQARVLQDAVEALIAEPSEATMTNAREAWLAARTPYMQTEAYRFGNAIVDDWEGKVNAWPLDEGLIDYVDSGYGAESAENPVYSANIIASESLNLSGETIDVSTLTKDLLAGKLHELGGVEANVATGYHAVEFLLWGQDLNGTGAGNGDRPWTDYSTSECTNGHCDRRAEYLSTATDLLIDDLEWMTDQWTAEGEARQSLLADTQKGIAAILTGLGSLSYGELAGERMQLGLMLHDPEEEHDCFSDDTHNSHYYDVVGMINVYSGSYTRVDGRRVVGPGLSHLVAASDPALNREMFAKLDATEAAMGKLKERAENTEAYDQMIGPDNPEGNAVVQGAIDALTSQTQTIEKVVASLDLEPIAFEGSDSLDDPEAVFE
ncbi:MAG: imelysin family protein [Gammaproteobacteria bacterium]|nr:imelysin family protein [Gammaproteobacteria bacterium]